MTSTADICAVLRDAGRPMTTEELREALGKDSSKISSSLMSLLKTGTVERTWAYVGREEDDAIVEAVGRLSGERRRLVTTNALAGALRDSGRPLGNRHVEACMDRLADMGRVERVRSGDRTYWRALP